jgi:hypothetical protein
MTEHVHDMRPMLWHVNNSLVFERKLTADPLYPFCCMTCPEVRWVTADKAAEQGLIRLTEYEP